MRVLLTGVAGFVGFHLASVLLERGHEVLGLDSLNDYYDPRLKHDRLAALGTPSNFRFAQVDIVDAAALRAATDGLTFDIIIHLAAQAGVRYSLINPGAYVDANVRGHLNVLELARHADGLRQIIYASSSSVYGDRSDTPFRETDRCDSPASIYAATKKAGELIAQSYASLFGFSAVGLRFFTVYGPWGRPDMAYWSFTEAILKGEPIRLFNNGLMRRDFTDIRDIVEGIVRMAEAAPRLGHEIYNIGHSEPVTLARFVAAIERATGVRAIVEKAPMQAGDVGDTFADVSKLETSFGYRPTIAIEEGIERFVAWFREYKGF
ncbi:MAG: NAD-dependent epimerase/dehydratase family protein [Alphaproteobacteria bacterium]|nr:NAD-dependent epimerase/dehydratase family protein [Alphaproteobacteria bacterium]